MRNDVRCNTPLVGKGARCAPPLHPPRPWRALIPAPNHSNFVPSSPVPASCRVAPITLQFRVSNRGVATPAERIAVPSLARRLHSTLHTIDQEAFEPLLKSLLFKDTDFLHTDFKLMRLDVSVICLIIHGIPMPDNRLILTIP